MPVCLLEQAPEGNAIVAANGFGDVGLGMGESVLAEWTERRLMP